MIVKLFNNTQIKVEDDEVQKVLKGVKEKDQIIYLKNGVFNSSAFLALVRDADELWDKKNQKEGTLHDGTSVIRYFGLWYLDGEFDENGKPYRHIDPTYYPEVARDIVPTRQEFQTKYKHLPRKERLKLICQGTRDPKSGGMKQIGEVLTGRLKQLTSK